MNNDLVKLLGAYILAEQNHRNIADLLMQCLLDWKHDPIIYGAIDLQIKIELAAADALQAMSFNITKHSVQGEPVK